MSGRVFEQFHLVIGPPNDAAFAHDHCANRDFLGCEGARSLAEGFAHEVMIALQIDDRLVGHGTSE